MPRRRRRRVAAVLLRMSRGCCSAAGAARHLVPFLLERAFWILREKIEKETFAPLSGYTSNCYQGERKSRTSTGTGSRRFCAPPRDASFSFRSTASMPTALLRWTGT